ncbi:MAG TPA: HD domain-containing protein [Haloplasmataceae bacterium]
MIYTPLTKKAMNIAYEAHKNQLDKSGVPYIFHPIHVAEQMNDELSTCVALLHDVVEDSSYTIQDLINKGFPNEVIEAIKVLTHSKNIPYLDYIKNIKTNTLARIVKIADLKHNSDLTRLDCITEEDENRKAKYIEALHLLEF